MVISLLGWIWARTRSSESNDLGGCVSVDKLLGSNTVFLCRLSVTWCIQLIGLPANQYQLGLPKFSMLCLDNSLSVLSFFAIQGTYSTKLEGGSSQTSPLGQPPTKTSYRTPASMSPKAAAFPQAPPQPREGSAEADLTGSCSFSLKPGQKNAAPFAEDWEAVTAKILQYAVIQVWFLGTTFGVCLPRGV